MKSKILSKTVIVLSLVSLFTDVASEMLYPVMPVFLKSIGFSVLLIGILEGLAETTAGLSKGYFGNLSDTKGKRLPFVRIGYSLSAVSKPLMIVFSFPVWIFFSRTLDRLGKGIRTSARDAILSDESTAGNKGKVFGFHRSMDTIGASIGPIIALIYLYFNPENYRILFLISIVPGIIAILLTFFIKEKKKTDEKRKQKVSFFSYLRYWKSASYQYKLIVIGLLIFALFNSSDAFLLLLLKNNGFSDSQMIGFYIFYNLIYALFSYPAGMAADKIGMKKVLISGLFLFAVVYISISFFHSFLWIGFFFLLYGIYAASTEGISKALITNNSEKNETATALGFYNSFASVISFASSTLAGFLWFVVNPKATFIFSGTGVLLVAIYFCIVLLKRSDKLQNNLSL